jgi:hypothetical protein
MKRFHNLMAAEVEQEFTTRTIESETCTVLAQNSTSSQVFMKQQWSALDRIVDSHPGSKVSGGIFLYPRQSRLLHSIVRLLSEIVLEREDRNLNVCESKIAFVDGCKPYVVSWQQVSPSRPVPFFCSQRDLEQDIRLLCFSPLLKM